jgi:hypothetical protein
VIKSVLPVLAMKLSIKPLKNAINAIRAAVNVTDQTIIIVQNVVQIIYKPQIKNVHALMEDTSIKALWPAQFALHHVHLVMVQPQIIVRNATVIFSYNQIILAKNACQNFILILHQVNAYLVVWLVIIVRKIRINVHLVLQDLILIQLIKNALKLYVQTVIILIQRQINACHVIQHALNVREKLIINAPNVLQDFSSPQI